MAKDQDYIRLIGTSRWRHLRKSILTSHPLCERCMKTGRISPATEVHHITPVETALSYAGKESLMYDPHNLMALCHDCHVLTHKEMGRSGKDARRKRNEEHLQRVIDKYLK